MNDNEHLTEVAVQYERWREAAEGVVNLGWETHDIVEEEAAHLTRAVICGHIAVADLRHGVQYASALDVEAVKRYGSDITTGEERVERTARRIMHHSGRTALSAVKTSSKRVTMQVKYTSHKQGYGRISL